MSKARPKAAKQWPFAGKGRRPLAAHDRSTANRETSSLCPSGGEPHRVCRRLSDASYAAMASVSRSAQ
jgi:hypothetical protein